jgi:cytochrome c553
VNIISTFVIVISVAVIPAGAQNAADNYKSKCQMCHAANGNGDTPTGKKLNVNDFHSAEVQRKTDDQLFKAIKDGVNANGKLVMPAYNGKLTDDQIRDLAKYSRDLGKK